MHGYGERGFCSCTKEGKVGSKKCFGKKVRRRGKGRADVEAWEALGFGICVDEENYGFGAGL